MNGIKRYFSIKELVCPHVYDKFREYAWNFFDPRLLETLLVIREKCGLPIVINNWAKGGQLLFDGEEFGHFPVLLNLLECKERNTPDNGYQ